MFIGPVFQREVVIAPRRNRIYILRTVYVTALLVLIATAWWVLSGTQRIRDLGDYARFGTILFQIFAPLQMAWAAFFAAVVTAAAVAQEKDRRTLLLLLLTRLTNCEIVLGKWLAVVLYVLVMLLASVPVFLALAMLGGISGAQIARVYAVTVASVLLCGSLGSVSALWRDKTFQALALTIFALVFWLAAGEILASGVLGQELGGVSCRVWATGVSPWRAVIEAMRPFADPVPALGPLQTPVFLFLAVSLAAAGVLNLVAIAGVRRWNATPDAAPVIAEEERTSAEAPGAEPASPRPDAAGSESVPGGWKEKLTTWQRRQESPDAPAGVPIQQAAAASRSRTRTVWDNPILWREIRTWAYGRKILLIRLAYWLLFALAVAGVYWLMSTGQWTAHASGAAVLVPLLLLSLILVNAQAVTALTSERDVKALDLLLVTDLTPQEIVFGKLGGVLYNTKEIILLPLLLLAYLGFYGVFSAENALFLLLGLTTVFAFCAVLGLHAGMTYENTGSAVGVSLGTLFFLTIGMAACMRIMLALSDSFQAQFIPFFAYMVLGGAGLYVVLGARNPSTAIGVASFLCPFATFYAVTSYLLGSPLAVFFTIVAAYGFTTAALLVPALYEFDVATGRTTLEEG
ncbi:MAG: ABC transporter permease subunit [Pirellulales bacterium]|nr:ABC transporter permease subunit [Pirellulales bacterium]